MNMNLPGGPTTRDTRTIPMGIEHTVRRCRNLFVDCIIGNTKTYLEAVSVPLGRFVLYSENGCPLYFDGRESNYLQYIPKGHEVG
jgi:hypothetical protein